MSLGTKAETARIWRPDAGPLLEQLNTQTTSFLQRLELHQTEGRLRFSPEKINFLSSFIHSFAKTRNDRADEVDTDAYREALDFINDPNLFPYSTFNVDCIDGRVLPILVGGFIAKFGGALRIPAAQPKEFIIDNEGQAALREDSNFAHRLNEFFEKQDGEKKDENTLVQILDSHLGCAAREIMSPGHIDKGLWVDVKEKRYMAKALQRHTEKNHKGKRILPIQVSFDPANGGLYMGLERDEVFYEGEKDKSFYSEKTQLMNLAVSGKIISSEMIAWQLAPFGPNDGQKVFDQFEFKPRFDWRKDYVNSARQFWAYIGQMVDHGVLESKIIPMIKEVYKQDFDTMDPGEIKTRALLLLSNAFSFYLHNRDENGHLPISKEGAPIYNNYQHAVHRERCVAVTEGGYAPFPADPEDPSGQNMDAFVVYSKDLDSLPANVITAVSIVQANRREKRIIDDAHMPVPVIVKRIERSEFTDDDWKRLESMDFSDMPDSWIYWDRDLLENYISGKENTKEPTHIKTAVWELLRKIQTLYDPKNGLVQSITNGDVVIVPAIFDQDRRMRKIIPFTRNGLDASRT